MVLFRTFSCIHVIVLSFNFGDVERSDLNPRNLLGKKFGAPTPQSARLFERVVVR